MTKAKEPVRTAEEAKVLFNQHQALTPWFIHKFTDKKKTQEMGGHNHLVSHINEELWQACLLWEEGRSKFATYAVWRMRKGYTTFLRQRTRKSNLNEIPFSVLVGDDGPKIDIKEIAVYDPEIIERDPEDRGFTHKFITLLKTQLKKVDVDLLTKIYVEEKTYVQAGKDLGISKQGIDCRLRRIRDRLQNSVSIRKYDEEKDYSGSLMSDNRQSLADKVTAAAHMFGDEKFTLSELVVACWKQDPRQFCLQGYPEYPDSNKISACLSGVRGLVAKGVLSRVCPGVYVCVSDSTGRIKKEQNTTLPKDLQRVADLTDRLLNCDVSFITPQIAAALWGTHPIKAKNTDVAVFVASLQMLSLRLEKQQTVTTTKGTSVTKAHVDSLRDLHNRAMDRYSKVLGQLRMGDSHV